MMYEYQPITLIDSKKNGGSKVKAEAVSLYSWIAPFAPDVFG